MNDSQLTIASSAKRFFSGTLISRFSGFGRELLMAAAFGTQPSVAAFWMAFRFIYLLRRLFGEGALHSAFIPHFETLKKEDPQKAATFFYELSYSLVKMLFVLILVAEVLLALFLHFGNISLNVSEVLKLTMLLLPASIFVVLYAINQAALNCERSYFLPSAAPAVVNVLWILAVILLWKKPAYFAMQDLALIVVIALILQWAVTLPKVLPLLRVTSKEKMALFPILRPFLLSLLGVAATQINSALDTIFARFADPQGPAYLWYAIRVQQLPLALFGVALAGALLPPLTRAIAENDREKTKSFLLYAKKRIILLMLPLTAAIYLFGRLAITLLYGHGKFGSEAIEQTSRCLEGYGLGLLPMSLILIYVTAFTARKNYFVPMIAAVASVALNITLNSLFVLKFSLSAPSIAYATSISAFVNVALLMIMSYERETRKQH